MDLDVEILARIQFALTIMFHYIFPPFSIGLGLIIVIIEALYVRTKNPAYEKLARFWVKIFAANFSVGVATGIVMEFEFGTNWATYSRFVGDVFGSPLAAEGIFAFFLESGFLAVLLFGWNKVSSRMHLFAACMVFLGSMLSGYWITVANSWMQTPAGYELVSENGQMRAVITSFWEMVFNPSANTRVVHVLLGALLQGSFLVLSISAFYIVKNRHLELAQRTFIIGVFVSGVVLLAQFLAGHQSAQMVATHQPAKLAAMEGIYKNEKGAPLYIFGYSDQKSQETKGLAIPKMLSFLVAEDFDYEVKGLNSFPENEQPPVNRVFQVYHLMIACGMAMLGLLLLVGWFALKKKLFSTKWLLQLFVPAVVLPIIANQTGWMTAEFGRQPWVVYGLLRTEDAISKTVSGSEILGSIILFSVVYLLLFLVWLYVLNKEIQHGPDAPEKTLMSKYDQRRDKMNVLLKHLG